MYLLVRGFDLSFRTGISWFTRPMSLFCHQKMTRKREQNLGDPQSISRKASNLRTFQPWKNGRCPRIYEVLILLSRLWADSANGRLHHSRGFDLFNCRFWHDLRGFDLAFSPRETWFTRFWSQERQYIYYIYNVYTRFWSRLRHSDGLLFARSWSHSVSFRPAPMHEVLISLLAGRRELIHEVCISLRRAESPKRDQNLVNGVTLGETGADTKCDSLS